VQDLTETFFSFTSDNGCCQGLLLIDTGIHTSSHSGSLVLRTIEVSLVCVDNHHREEKAFKLLKGWHLRPGVAAVNERAVRVRT
jgi:hypothetical protein